MNINMDDIYSFTLEYFIIRQLWNLGYLPFSKYKKIISFATGIYNIYYLRKIFLHLVRKGFFQKKKNVKRSYTYKFIGIEEESPFDKVNFK
tara:strand:- start:6273 stop:6545 length:273 start_codon:yes stop_codon:yes gene_type:complete